MKISLLYEPQRPRILHVYPTWEEMRFAMVVMLGTLDERTLYISHNNHTIVYRDELGRAATLYFNTVEERSDRWWYDYAGTELSEIQIHDCYVEREAVMWLISRLRGAKYE